MVKYSKQVKSTSIALLIFSLLTISIDTLLLTTQILNDLLPTFGIGILLGLFGILAGSYGICAAKATRAEHFFGKYTTSGCWSVFGGIFAFFGLAWLSFAFSCHAICINENSSDEPSAFYMMLTGHNFTDDGWKPIKPADIGWLANGTCINFQKDWTVKEETTVPPEADLTTASFIEPENVTDIFMLDYEDWLRNDTESDDSNFTTQVNDINATITVSTVSTTDSDTDSNNEDHYENNSIVIAYMSLYLTELVLVFILFIIFIVLSNATGCCYCESNSVDIEADEEESYKNDSSSDEDSSDSSSDDSSDEE